VQQYVLTTSRQLYSVMCLMDQATLIDTVASTTGGCDTARTITITTAPLLTTTVSATVCANDFPATIFGHVFNGPATLIDTVASTTEVAIQQERSR
jgi:hypothetical protein